MLSVQVKRISSRKIQDQLPDYDWSESLDPLSNPHLLEWLRDQERAFQVCPSKTIYLTVMMVLKFVTTVRAPL